MKMKLFITSLLVILGLTSCSIEDELPVISYGYEVAQSVIIPDSFNFGETYDIEVSFTLTNDCYIFSGFEMVPNSIQRTVRIVSTQIQPNGSCENSIPENQSKTLRFQVKSTGIYVFKFLSGYDDLGNETFLEFTVPVNQ
jgi:hypothetical protein